MKLTKKVPQSRKGCAELQAATLGDHLAFFEMHIIAFLAALNQLPEGNN